MSEEEDFTKLSLKQRLSHKSWKARQSAYQELGSTFEKCSLLNIPNEVSAYWEYPEQFSKFIVDSNVVAQESAIGALHTLLGFMAQMADSLPDTSLLRSEWIPPLVEKGLSSSRAGTKTKSLESILFLASFDNSIRSTIELMLPFTANKLPRLVSSLMNALAKLVESFGFIGVKNDFWPEVLNPLPKLAGHADRNVRSETMNFILEIYKWVGKEFLESLLLEKLKPIQQKDLDKLFAQYDGTIPPASQPRLFHWQILMQQETAVAGVDGDGDTLMGDAFANSGKTISPVVIDGSATAVADPYDLLPVVSIMKNFPPDFEAQTKSPKWKDRVEALQKVYDEILKPAKKLDQSDDYSLYIRILVQILVKDANLQAATTAANSVAHLVTCLREGIAPYAPSVLDALLQRTKEKKPSVSEAVGEALDLVSKYHGVDNCLECAVEYMNHKIPQVRLEATNFLTRMLQKEWRQTKSKLKDEAIVRMLPDIVPAIVKVVNDTQPSLRDSGFECFATMMKLLGEKEFSDALEKVGSQKKKKIYEHYEKVVLTAPPVVPAITNNHPPPSHAQHGRTAKLTNTSTTMNHAKYNPLENRSLTHQDSSQKLKSPSSSIPIKRGPSSPLKDKNQSKGNAGAKPRLVGRSANHPARGTQFTSSSLAPPQPANSQVSAASAALMTELEELRNQKAKWNKERQELVAKLTSFQTQTSQLNSENQMLQNQLNDFQMTLNEKTMTLRSKDLQITKLKNRLATLESELDAMLTASNIPNTPAKTVLEGIHSISPSRNGSVNGESVYGDINHSDPCISIHPHNPQQSRKTSGGSLRINTGLTSRFSPLASSILVATSSESNDDLQRRVNSLHIMDTSNAVAGSTPTNGSSTSFFSDESWKRAAEVTNQLKARIERMRAKTRGLNLDADDV
ncbi:HBL241Cp [Eremothecium sinecaudum]|uniref:HBL241Cp n=1 Tax=Eremothecium sinecaudum TaxID=45286 RepID=A0A120K0U1_9SACH|nr:HBL241Cp [Eremothecium sinecaudum]AMD18661.1 HBL241Cp [Eremothecium sinecaudum]